MVYLGGFPARTAAWIAVICLMTGMTGVQAQHGHLNAGALGTEQGSKVAWINGGLFAESSGYIGNMPKATSGTYMGYHNSGPTLTALPTTIANGGPSGSASAPGSFLQFSYTLLAGPEGATFSFWDSGSPTPSSTMGLGQTSPLFALSGGEDNPTAGAPGADPYGHLHGRRFTADLPGDYIVGFVAVDTSANGSGGGPIHLPSDTLNVRFRVVPEPEAVALMVVGFASVLFMGRRRMRTGGSK